jgi:hypothetical protein
MPKSDKDDDIRDKLRTDNEAPKWLKSRTDIDEASRAKDLMDNEAPIQISSQMESAAPKRHLPSSDSVEPRRA